MINNIDEKLLAGKLRKEKMKAVAESNVNYNVIDYNVVDYNAKDVNIKLEDIPLYVENTPLLMARKQKRRNIFRQEKGNNSARAMSSRALRWAWMALIPSWGLSLIYINAHAFLSVIFPNIVCKLGEEWLPPQVRGRASSGLSYLEWTGLAVLDFIVFCIIMFIVALLGAIIRFLDSSVVGKIILKLLS